VHHDRQTAQRRPPLDVGDEVRRDLHALHRRPEYEVAGVEHELPALGHDRLVDVVGDLRLAVGVDRGDVGTVELQELPAQPQVDAGRLDLQLGVVQRFDDEVALLHPGEDVPVGQYHGQHLSERRPKAPGPGRGGCADFCPRHHSTGA
jgi:hypothetical protein